MKNENQKILILKSNIATTADVLNVQYPLDHHPGIVQWNIDVEDCDHVIRIVTPYLTVADINSIAEAHGYHCSELE